jgi:hypothetical protein
VRIACGLPRGGTFRRLNRRGPPRAASASYPKPPAGARSPTAGRGRRFAGRPATADEAPIILDEYANTSSAGSIVAFHQHHDDLRQGDLGLICSFGAGYSIGSVMVRRR